MSAVQLVLLLGMDTVCLIISFRLRSSSPKIQSWFSGKRGRSVKIQWTLTHYCFLVIWTLFSPYRIFFSPFFILQHGLWTVGVHQLQRNRVSTNLFRTWSPMMDYWEYTIPLLAVCLVCSPCVFGYCQLFTNETVVTCLLHPIFGSSRKFNWTESLEQAKNMKYTLDLFLFLLFIPS